MGNKQSTQRRNTDNTEQHLQYRTPKGPVPAAAIPLHLEDAPAPNTRTRSRYPREYRNNEGQRGQTRTQPIDDFETGPGRAQGPAGRLHEYPIPPPDTQFRFRYDDPCMNAHQVERRIHRNERANVFGPADGRPGNDPMTVRAAVRVAQVDGKDELITAGVLAHPPGNRTGFQRAPIEPLDRQGRQILQRDVDEKGRTRTYPPRGLDAAFVEGVETNHERVHRPTYPQMRRR
ncbi:hypothetical protein CGCSCA5_v001996 [Colletotrichum siamense]|nr:hypothetical protein CGCSCA5_v001996 [Colletotrichum siamense]